MTDKKEEEKKEDDERLEYIFKYLALSRKIKLEKWIKMLTNEEYKVYIYIFFPFYILTLHRSRQLSANLHTPLFEMRWNNIYPNSLIIFKIAIY